MGSKAGLVLSNEGNELAALSQVVRQLGPGRWISAHLSHTGNCSQEQSDASLKQKWCLCYIFFCYNKLFPGWFSCFAHISLTPTNTLSDSWQVFSVNICAPWRDAHKAQLLCRGEMCEAATAPWWQFQRTRCCVHRAKKGNVQTSALSVLCHSLGNRTLRVRLKFQSFDPTVWNNSPEHVFTGSIQQVCNSHIFANFSNFWKSKGCAIIFWGPLWLNLTLSFLEMPSVTTKCHHYINLCELLLRTCSH